MQKKLNKFKNQKITRFLRPLQVFASLFLAVTLLAGKLWAQAPVISYSTPQTFSKNVTISPLAPVNTGGAVPIGVATIATGVAPVSVAVDASGNVYVADDVNNQIKKIPAGGGAVVTLPAAFNTPTGVAVDAAGNVYVADHNNNRVQKIPAGGGTITTLLSGTVSPYGIAVDASGNVYVSDWSTNVIDKIPPAGGSFVALGSGLNTPTGIAIDASGNLFVTDRGNKAVKEILAAGGSTVTLTSGLTNPNGVAVDAAGNVYFADTQYTTIKEIPVGGGALIDLTPGVGWPLAVAIDGGGTLYVGDGENGLVKEFKDGGYVISPALPAGLVFDTNTGIITGKPTAARSAANYAVIAHNSSGSDSTTINISVIILPPPTVSYSSPQLYTVGNAITPLAPTSSGTGPVPAGAAVKIATGFKSPTCLAFDAQGNLYIADNGNKNVRMVPATGGTPLFIGSGFVHPTGVAVDQQGNVYVVDNGSRALKKVMAGSGTIVTLRSFSGSDDPYGVAVDAAGNIFVSNRANNTIDKIPPAGGSFVTVGSGINSPQGLAADASGNVFVANRGDNTIKEIVASSGSTVTLASGSGSLNSVTVDRAGNVYFVDLSSPAVKEIPAGGGSLITIGSGLVTPAGVAVDGANNVYLTNNLKDILRIKPAGAFFIKPSLPPGLWFDNTTGTISGTPTFALPAANYTVTAFNSAGDSVTTVVNIAVTTTNADLADLQISKGALSPSFATGTTSYTANVTVDTTAVRVTPVTANSQATVKVNGSAVTSGSPSPFVILSPGSNIINVVVTAADGVTTKTYTVTVTRPSSTSSNNDHLSSLVLSSGTLSPGFDGATVSYTASVSNATSSVTVTPTTVEAGATVTVNGATVASGSASGSIPLAIGNNTINIVVTAQDGTTVRTTTIAILRPSNNAYLSGLDVKGPNYRALAPGFNQTVNSYTTIVPMATSSVTIIPHVSYSAATVKVNGVTVASGTQSNPIPVSPGSNTITILVTAQEGTHKTYTLVVKRLSSDDSLSNLTISSGVLSPVFASGTPGYTTSVSTAITSVTITPTASDPLATITVWVNGVMAPPVSSGMATGSLNIGTANALINIEVLAEDGESEGDYDIVINRPSNNAYLSNLTVSGGTLSPAFTMTNGTYKDTVSNATTSITVTPTLNNPHGSIMVNGTAIASGATSASIPLGVGNNTISTVVTAQDGVTHKTYTVTVTRISNNAYLSSLMLSSGTLSPVFSLTTGSYTASISNGTTAITVTPTLNNPYGSIKVNGTAVSSGAASGSIALSVGDNVISTVVTAQDGVTHKTYTVTVNRAMSGMNSLYLPGSGDRTELVTSLGEKIEANNILSPNGDGINDIWVVKNIAFYPDNTVTVYNKAGEVVFTRKGYTNDWNGTYRGSVLSEGTYYYSVDLGNGTTKKGFITVVSH